MKSDDLYDRHSLYNYIMDSDDLYDRQSLYNGF